ncbi:transcriptional regulator [Erysipelotrichaceae bacterium]|nr:transcriptional regulator [Erysipelotrichaceae bacterium]
MRILVVEDDYKLNQAIFEILKKEYTVDVAYDGEEGLYFAQEGVYDLILLDIMMPKMDGYEVLRELRKQEVMTPVIYISAKDSVEDRIKGLQLSSDDYLIKPFHEVELLLRIQAILKRYDKHVNLKFESLELLTEERALLCGENKIQLKGKQYEILEYFMQNPNRILTKEQLFDKIWGIYSDTTITVVEVYAHGIRKLLKPSGLDYYLQTIRGVGYMFTNKVRDKERK